MFFLINFQNIKLHTKNSTEVKWSLIFSYNKVNYVHCRGMLSCQLYDLWPPSGSQA